MLDNVLMLLAQKTTLISFTTPKILLTWSYNFIAPKKRFPTSGTDTFVYTNNFPCINRIFQGVFVLCCCDRWPRHQDCRKTCSDLRLLSAIPCLTHYSPHTHQAPYCAIRRAKGGDFGRFDNPLVKPSLFK